MAKRINYNFNKRQRELKKAAKAQKKLEQRLAKSKPAAEDATPADPPAPEKR
jgi:hypothetical protein